MDVSFQKDWYHLCQCAQITPPTGTSPAASQILLKKRSAMDKCFVLLMFCITLLGFPVPMVGDEGSDFLDRIELEVEQIANLSIINVGQQCELLATCDNPTNCSHDACSLEDTGNYQCMVVNKNKHCSLYGTTNTSCENMNLDYGGSYIRVAASTNLKSVDTMLAICSQRPLEPLFKTLSKPTLLTRIFFAPMDGSFRIYPGTAQAADACGTFDPRVRPWFRTSTSVVKIVVVLIDLGASMGSNLPPDLGTGTILLAAKNIAKQLLNTLSGQDFVNIILYDSSRLIQLSPSAVLVQEHNVTEAPELDSLRKELDKQTVEGQYRASNLSAAILAALPNFESNTQAAKVIIVITDGVFATLGNVTLPTAELSNSRVKVFMYKLKQPNDKDIFLENNTLIRQLCAVGGHFEPILKNLENPLLAFQKYFSYLANLKRILTNGRPQYSYVYQDFEGVGGNIISISKPVFFEGNLVGVVAKTIHIGVLGNITDQVKQALGSRLTGYCTPAAPDVVLSAANCNVVSESLQPCGSSTAYYTPTGGLCLRTDPTRSTIQELLCCGTCSAPPPGHPDGSGHSAKVIAGIVGGFLGLVVAVVACICVYSKRKKKQQEVEQWLADLPNQVPPLDEYPRIGYDTGLQMNTSSTARREEERDI